MERTYTVDELFGAVRRRWKRAAVVAAVFFALAALVISRLPNEYKARALVMVESMHPHPDLVTPVISTTLEDKVKSVRAQLYSRTLLATAIEELKLYPREREKGGGMDAAVEALRNDLEVHAEGDNAFTIVVRSRDPQVAAQTANRLAELFIEGNLQVRAGQVTRTRDIISSKLAEMRAELAASETKIASFKQAHATELPELVEARLREREQLGKQIELEENFIKDAQRRIDLTGTQPFGKDTEVGRLEEEYDTLRGRVAAASAQLTPEHPDVVKLQRELASSQARLHQARTRAASNDLESRRMQEAINRGRKQIAVFEQRIAAIDRTVSAGPMVAMQLTELSRDADMVKAKVTQLVGKKAEAEIAADLEAKQAPSEFRVLESASAPSLPSAPNRPQDFLLALLAAIALGVALAMGQELSDRSVRNEEEAGTAVALPVLASIPRLGAVTSGRRLLALSAGNEA